MKTQYKCICGSWVNNTPDSSEKHIQSKKHKVFINEQPKSTVRQVLRDGYWVLEEV